MSNPQIFTDRDQVQDIEEGAEFAPKFDAHGMMPAIATDAKTGETLMFAFMNAEALKLTLETGLAHYYSRSRKALWKKGESSGHTQKVVECRTDCDQDVIWLRIEQEGAACHVGFRSCFYRSVVKTDDGFALTSDAEKVFDPKDVY